MTRGGFTPYHVEAPPVRGGRRGGQPEGNLRRRRPSGRGTGFTLLEIIVASVLLAAVVAGVFGAFSTASQWFQESTEGVPYNLARERLDELQETIAMGTWNTGPLAATATWIPDGTVTLNGKTYTRSYRVDPVVGRQYRRVQMRLTWP